MDALRRPLILVAGPGGSGKTTVAAALSLALSTTEGPVALASLADPREHAGLLGEPVRPEPDGEGAVRLVEMDGTAAVRRFLKRHAPGAEARAERHPLFGMLLEQVPALTEALLLGRAVELSRGPDARHVVVDVGTPGLDLRPLAAPHQVETIFRHDGLGTLAAKYYGYYRTLKRVQSGLGGLLRGRREEEDGPDLSAILDRLAADIRRIGEALKDPSRTSLVVVATPQHRDVREVRRLREGLAATTGLVPAVLVVNRLVDAASARESKFLAAEHEAQKTHAAILRDDVPVPTVALPAIPGGIHGRADVERLVSAFAR
ncbi:MAG: ArsA family ATPase [Methanobacteriota archaeon]